MTRALGLELAAVVMREADAIQDAYAWPPKVLTADEIRERDRLHALSRRIAYRANTLQGVGE